MQLSPAGRASAGVGCPPAMMRPPQTAPAGRGSSATPDPEKGRHGAEAALGQRSLPAPWQAQGRTCHRPDRPEATFTRCGRQLSVPGTGPGDDGSTPARNGRAQPHGPWTRATPPPRAAHACGWGWGSPRRRGPGRGGATSRPHGHAPLAAPHAPPPGAPTRCLSSTRPGVARSSGAGNTCAAMPTRKATASPVMSRPTVPPAACRHSIRPTMAGHTPPWHRCRPSRVSVEQEGVHHGPIRSRNLSCRRPALPDVAVPHATPCRPSSTEVLIHWKDREHRSHPGTVSWFGFQQGRPGLCPGPAKG